MSILKTRMTAGLKSKASLSLLMNLDRVQGCKDPGRVGMNMVKSSGAETLFVMNGTRPVGHIQSGHFPKGRKDPGVGGPGASWNASITVEDSTKEHRRGTNTECTVEGLGLKVVGFEGAPAEAPNARELEESQELENPENAREATRRVLGGKSGDWVLDLGLGVEGCGRGLGFCCSVLLGLEPGGGVRGTRFRGLGVYFLACRELRDALLDLKRLWARV